MQIRRPALLKPTFGLHPDPLEQVTIEGAGFENNGPVGFEGTGDNKLTTVFFGNNICKTEEYFSNDLQIVCYAPPLGK